jgi:hypothetical protein
LKIIRANNNMEGVRPLIARQFGLVFDLKRNSGRQGPRCRQVRRHRDSLSARNLLEPGQQIPHEEELLGVVLAASIIERHASGKKMVHAKAEILMLNEEKPA